MPKPPIAAPGSWLAFFRDLFVSNTAAALVTVVVGGLFGHWILARYQDRAKADAIALAQYRAFISKQQDVIGRAYDLLGGTAADSRALIELTQPEFQPRYILPGYRAAARAQAQRFLEAHNRLSAAWDQDRYKMDSLMRYYFSAKPQVLTMWTAALGSAEALRTCASQTYNQFNMHHTFPSPAICEPKIEKFERALKQLSRAVASARSYTWQQAVTPSGQ